MANAKYYLITCETLSGEEAERTGLVSKCVDDDDVLMKRNGSRPISQQVLPPQSTEPNTASINGFEYSDRPWTASLGLDFIGFGGPEVRKGLAAHREKRAPDFTNWAAPKAD